jgi:hypothetical protein
MTSALECFGRVSMVFFRHEQQRGCWGFELCRVVSAEHPFHVGEAGLHQGDGPIRIRRPAAWYARAKFPWVWRVMGSSSP